MMFTAYWAPEGKPIFRTEAKSLELARKWIRTPLRVEILDNRLEHMLHYRGEIYWEER